MDENSIILGDHQVVVFELENQVYGININSVREIIRLPQITRLPNTKDYIKGIINLRGFLTPVISLAACFNLQEVKENSDARIIIVNQIDQTIGLIVDKVTEIININQCQVEEPPINVGNIFGDYLTGIIKNQDNLIILLEVNKLLFN